MSPKAVAATKIAVQLAHQFNSKITLLNVHDEFMSDDEMHMLRVSVKKMKDEFHKTAESAKSEMKNIIHELHADDITVEFLLREGKAPKTICSVSE